MTRLQVLLTFRRLVHRGLIRRVGWGRYVVTEAGWRALGGAR